MLLESFPVRLSGMNDTKNDPQYVYAASSSAGWLVSVAEPSKKQKNQPSPDRSLLHLPDHAIMEIRDPRLSWNSSAQPSPSQIRIPSAAGSASDPLDALSNPALQVPAARSSGFSISRKADVSWPAHAAQTRDLARKERTRKLEQIADRQAERLYRLHDLPVAAGHVSRPVNFVVYDYLHSGVKLHADTETRFEKASSLHAWLNLRCLKAGTSVDGAKASASLLLDSRRHLPILVSLHPLELWMIDRDPENRVVLINFAHISSIETTQKNRCRIRFADGFCMESANAKQTERIFLAAQKFLRRVYSSQSSQ